MQIPFFKSLASLSGLVTSARPVQTAATSSVQPGEACPRTRFQQAQRQSLGKPTAAAGSQIQQQGHLAEIARLTGASLRPQAPSLPPVVPAWPNPNNAQACLAFVDAHQITARDLLTELDTLSEGALAPLQGQNFLDACLTLHQLAGRELAATYSMPGGNPAGSTTRAQVLYSLSRNALAIACFPQAPAAGGAAGPGQTGFEGLSLKLQPLRQACEAVLNQRATPAQQELVDGILAEVHESPLPFLTASVSQHPFRDAGRDMFINTDRYWRGAVDDRIVAGLEQEAREYKLGPQARAALGFRDLCQTIVAARYSGADHGFVGDYLLTSLQTPPARSGQADPGTRLLGDDRIGLKLTPGRLKVETQTDPRFSIDLVQGGSSVSPQVAALNEGMLAEAIYNLPHPLLNNYASHLSAFSFDNSPGKNPMMITGYAQGGVFSTAMNIRASGMGDLSQVGNRELFYEMFLHELGHVFHHRELGPLTHASLKSDSGWGQWQEAMRLDAFKPHEYRNPDPLQAVSSYAQGRPLSKKGPENTLKLEDDLAESFALYILSAQNGSQDEYRAVFSHRFAFFDKYAAQLLDPQQLPPAR